MENVIFWAQSLDNKTPDIIEENGIRITPEDRVKRQKAVEEFSTVTSEGKQFEENTNHKLFQHDDFVVIQLTFRELDTSGRKVISSTRSGPL